MSCKLLTGDSLNVLKTLPDNSVHCCVTSPPYWGLRDYGHDGQIGLESTPEAYVTKLVDVFREVRRVLRVDGTLWLNLGDSYTNQKSGDTYSGFNDRYFGRESDGGKQAKTVSGANAGRLVFPGLKPKDLVGIPWRVAFAIQADGWYLRQDIIWAKPNPMPESVTDRCTKSHEYVFLLTKSAKYWYDADAIKEPARNWGTRDRSNMRGGTTDPKLKHHGLRGGDEENPTRNKRDVWTVTTKPYKGAHFAVFPTALVTPMVLAGCPQQCCAVCGTGYERVVERTKSFESGSGRSGNEIVGKQDLTASETNSTPDVRKGPVVTTRTVGFRPSCKCGSDEVSRGVVLDPFGGSGTTGEVAESLCRDSVLIELNPAYVELQKQRTKQPYLQL